MREVYECESDEGGRVKDFFASVVITESRKEAADKRRRCGEREWESGWQKILLLLCGGIIRLHRYCCFMEGYPIYIGTASTLCCRRAIKIISLKGRASQNLTGNHHHQKVCFKNMILLSAGWMALM